jgi:hypothetical protein
MNKEHGLVKLVGGVGVGFLAGILVAAVPSVLAAPERRRALGLEISGETVVIGSTKSQVITRLSKRFDLENSNHLVDGSEFWFVKERGDSESSIGSLQFKNDVLVTAMRDWDQVELDTRTLTFVKAMYGAIEHVFGKTSPGTVTCTLNFDQGKQHMQIDLFSGNRSVSLAFVENNIGGKPHNVGFIEESVTK